MLFLSKISLTQYKNYDLSSFNFTERVIGICGLNGKGKTNLLDAIYYCCFTKSYFLKTGAIAGGDNSSRRRVLGCQLACVLFT